MIDNSKNYNDTNIPSINKILVPVDTTRLSRKAANYGIHLAEVEKAKELIVIHIMEDIKQGGAIGLRARYGDVRLVEGFRKAKKSCRRNAKTDRTGSQETESKHER